MLPTGRIYLLGDYKGYNRKLFFIRIYCNKGSFFDVIL